PPIMIRRDGTITRLADGGAVLGIFPDACYEEFTAPFESGDRLVLITDGITEAENEAGDDFGEDRLIQLLRDNYTRPAAELQKIVVDAFRAFTPRGPQDDATLVIVSKE